MTAAVPTTTACPRCATEAVAGDRFCEVCGADLAVRRADPADHVEITVDGAAAVGNRGHVRARNEDAVALGRTDGARVPDRVAAVVCDGVSSTRSSQLAARAAADAALDALLGDHGDEHGDEHDVRSAVAAGAAAAAALAPRGTPAPPSCTLVCGVRDSGVLTVAWVGDSRAYWLGEPGAAEPSTLLTADHTAAARPDAITRWLGGDVRLRVAALTPAGPGALLLCTDGLWKYLPDAAALAAVALPALDLAGPRAAASALVAAALAAGGADNVTVAVVPVPPRQEEP